MLKKENDTENSEQFKKLNSKYNIEELLKNIVLEDKNNKKVEEK